MTLPALLLLLLAAPPSISPSTFLAVDCEEDCAVEVVEVAVFVVAVFLVVVVAFLVVVFFLVVFFTGRLVNIDSLDVSANVSLARLLVVQARTSAAIKNTFLMSVLNFLSLLSGANFAKNIEIA